MRCWLINILIKLYSNIISHKAYCEQKKKIVAREIEQKVVEEYNEGKTRY